VGKRESDRQFLAKDSTKHKPVLKYYTKDINNALLVITATSVILSYALYAFLNNKGRLIFTLPIAIYVILRFCYLVMSGSVIGRKLEHAIYDWRIVLASALWVASTVFILYFS
jgi:hypothetical protein